MPSVAIIGTRGYPSFYGGFETAVRKLAPYLADAGWDVTVYGRPGSTKPTEADPRVNVVHTRGIESKSLSTLSFGLTASMHAARKKPDVALVMNVANGYFLPLLRARGIPTLVNVDGIEWDRAKWGAAAKFAFRTGANLTARWADELVVDAEEIGRRWSVDFNRDGVFIPYGGQEVAEKLPVELGLTSGKYALAVARFVPENTIPEFLDAVERIGKKMDVVVVGSSGYGGELEERAMSLQSRLTNVHWLGHVANDERLFSLWQHAGVYFHGHSVGGTNPALVQAMALGVATVARDTAYNREVLGTAGVFVAPHAADIATAIEDLMANESERRVLSSAALRRARAQYSWEGVCASYEAALRALIGKSDEGEPAKGDLGERQRGTSS